MIKFSILLPTRCRCKQLEMCVMSIYETISNSKEIELMIAIDNDDSDMAIVVSNLVKVYNNINFFIHKRDRGNSLVYHYFNYLASLARGKYVVPINDDCMFRTKRWDTIVYDKLEEFTQDKPDGFVLGITQDLDFLAADRFLKDFPITDFPFISKKAIDYLGYFFHPHFTASSADPDICKLYHDLKRTVDLRELCVIEHKPEEQRKHFAKIEHHFYTDYAPEFPNPIQDGIDTRLEKLLKYLEEKKC